ncbi:unnamed protein product [Camellia sinensis]
MGRKELKMEMIGGGGVEVIEDNEYCTTPKHPKNRIPELLECPPPPKKKTERGRSTRNPPKIAYFYPLDLDALFALSSSQ